MLFDNQSYIKPPYPNKAARNNRFKNRKSEMNKTNSDREDISLSVLDLEADRIVLRYSTIAAATALIPIPGVSFVADSPIQLLMVLELGDLYGVKPTKGAVKKVLMVILDNLIAAKVVKGVLDFAKAIPLVGQVLAPLASTLWTFAYSYAIGWIFKKTYRTAWEMKTAPDFSSSMRDLTKQGWGAGWAYVENNWKDILFKQQFILQKYEVDLKKLQSELQATIHADHELRQLSQLAWEEIRKDIGNQILTTEDFFNHLRMIADKLGTPSGDLIEAMLRLDGIDPNFLRELNESLSESRQINSSKLEIEE